MARYYFDLLEDATILQDLEGRELANESLAEREALRAALAMAEESFGRGLSSLSVAVREGARPVLTLSVAFRVERPDRA